MHCAEGDGLCQIHADTAANAQNDLHIPLRTELDPFVDLAEKGLLSGVQAGDLKSRRRQSLRQLFVMTARQKTAGGDDQKPLPQLADLLHHGLHLAGAIVNTDTAVVNKVFHSGLLNKLFWGICTLLLSIDDTVLFWDFSAGK